MQVRKSWFEIQSSKKTGCILSCAFVYWIVRGGDRAAAHPCSASYVGELTPSLYQEESSFPINPRLSVARIRLWKRMLSLLFFRVEKDKDRDGAAAQWLRACLGCVRPLI